MNIEPVLHELQQRGYLARKFGPDLSIQDMRNGFTTYVCLSEIRYTPFYKALNDRFVHQDVANMIIIKVKEMYKESPMYTNPGPTNKQMSNPAVKLAYEELQLIMKLAGE